MPNSRHLARAALLAGCADALIKKDAVSFDATASNNVAIYWGQNSYGKSDGNLAQQPLATYCADTDIDIIPMAFLYQMTTGTGGQPVVNLANTQDGCEMFEGTQLINCPKIGDDIKTCQDKYKKKILLSVGGATYTEGGFESSDAAEKAAMQMWATFGPSIAASSNSTAPSGSDSDSNSTASASTASSQYTDIYARDDAPKVLRPFGDAAIDGFDMDLESTNQNMVPFVKKLRELMDAETDRKYMLTAAPQCPFPDQADNEMLSSDVPFDAIWVQFYNNGCGVQSFTKGATNQTNFNFGQWDDWAANKSPNKDIKVYVGVPGGQTGAGSGYLDSAALAPVIEYAKTFKSFGGVMMWDATQAYANDGFLPAVKKAIGGTSDADPTSSSSSATASSTDASSSSTSMSSSSSAPAAEQTTSAASSSTMSSSSSSMAASASSTSAPAAAETTDSSSSSTASSTMSSSETSSSSAPAATSSSSSSISSSSSSAAVSSTEPAAAAETTSASSSSSMSSSSSSSSAPAETSSSSSSSMSSSSSAEPTETSSTSSSSSMSSSSSSSAAASSTDPAAAAETTSSSSSMSSSSSAEPTESSSSSSSSSSMSSSSSAEPTETSSTSSSSSASASESSTTPAAAASATPTSSSTSMSSTPTTMSTSMTSASSSSSSDAASSTTSDDTTSSSTSADPSTASEIRGSGRSRMIRRRIINHAEVRVPYDI